MAPTPGGLVDVTWLGLPGEYFDCTWLNENPVAGVIQGGGNQVVNVNVDATGLAPGTYNCDLIISSNDPDEPAVIFPVTLNVIQYPDINVTPTVLTFVVPEGGSDMQQLVIENTATAGSDNLNWSIDEQEVTLIADDGSTIPVMISKTEKITRMATAESILKVLPQKKREQIVEHTALEDIVGTASYPINEFHQGEFIPSNRLASTLLIETTTTPIGQALTELGIPYDLIATSDFTTIDFTPYNTIIIGMDGGLVSAASVQAVANEASIGKRLIMFGGTNWGDFYNGVMMYLLQHSNVPGCHAGRCDSALE